MFGLYLQNTCCKFVHIFSASSLIGDTPFAESVLRVCLNGAHDNIYMLSSTFRCIKFVHSAIPALVILSLLDAHNILSVRANGAHVVTFVLCDTDNDRIFVQCTNPTSHIPESPSAFTTLIF